MSKPMILIFTRYFDIIWKVSFIYWSPLLICLDEKIVIAINEYTEHNIVYLHKHSDSSKATSETLACWAWHGHGHAAWAFSIIAFKPSFLAKPFANASKSKAPSLVVFCVVLSDIITNKWFGRKNLYYFWRLVRSYLTFIVTDKQRF
jgi:hypothetical protein